MENAKEAINQTKDSVSHEKTLHSQTDQSSEKSLSEAIEYQDSFLNIESLPEIMVEESVLIPISQTLPTSLVHSTPNVDSKDIVETALDISVGSDNAVPQASFDSSIDLEDLSHDEGHSLITEEEQINIFEGVRWVLSDKVMMSEDEMRRYRRSVYKVDDKD